MVAHSFIFIRPKRTKDDAGNMFKGLLLPVILLVLRLSSVLKAEHGPSWREKLPKLSIVIPTKQPTVQTTQTSEKLPSKESQPLKNKTNTKRAEDVPSQKSIGEQFKETKEKGNKCVQQVSIYIYVFFVIIASLKAAKNCKHKFNHPYLRHQYNNVVISTKLSLT